MDCPQITTNRGCTHNGCGPLLFLGYRDILQVPPERLEESGADERTVTSTWGEQSLIISEVLRMVTEFASKLGDLSTVVSFAALVANGLIPELLLPKGLLLKHQAVRILTAFNYIKTGAASLGCSSDFVFVANRNTNNDPTLVLRSENGYKAEFCFSTTICCGSASVQHHYIWRYF